MHDKIPQQPCGVDSESWACQGCGGQMIGRRTADDRCPDCGHLPAAERAARITAATAALGDFRRFEDGSATWGDWAMWAGRLAAELGSVLEVER